MKIFMISILSLMISLGAIAQNSNEMKTGKTLVAYFSCTGTTKSVAEKIAATLQADLFEIKPATAYTSADLNWNDKDSRSSKEMADTTSRPAIAHKIENLAAYETIMVGYPIWWNVAPTIINTFLESYDFSGKTMIPFATSGSSRIDNSEKKLHATYPKLNWKAGKLLNGTVNASSFAGWITK